MGLMDFLKKGKNEPVKPSEPAKQKAVAPTPSQRVAAQPQATPQPQPQVSKPVPESQVKIEQETYIVKAGDSLSKIAKHFYNDANQWNMIYEANRAEIKNPDMIQPGQKLIIPKFNK